MNDQQRDNVGRRGDGKHREVVAGQVLEAARAAIHQVPAHRPCEAADPDDRMPEAPNAPLSADQIALITKWLSQGGQNNGCDAHFGGCDTSTVSYAAYILPLMQSRCQGCHSGTYPQGGIDLTTYSNNKTQALNGKLYATVSKSTGWMPKGGAKLDACTQSKIKSWADAGAPQN